LSPNACRHGTADKVNAEFFPDGRWRANFLINLGYGDPAGNYPRGPRLGFDQVAQSL
jgi:3-hydroxypropanoate dehydrogenase